MTSGAISDLQGLQDCVGHSPGPRDLKVIDHLDAHATDWIAASPFLFAGFGDGDAIAVTAGGGVEGFVRVDHARQLSLPVASLDDAHVARRGQGVGCLFLVPGLRETLRVNGRVENVDAGHVVVTVQECYLHCAKALIRSAFWEALPREEEAHDAHAFLHACRFMALATIDQAGRADLSPKGDPAGALLQVREEAVWYPDRPGNRRVDSFRNILEQPRIAALALVPGCTQLAYLSGTVHLSTDAAMREAFAVDGKIPKLVACIRDARLRLQRSAALARAQLWPVTPTKAALDPAAIFKAHVQASRGGGMQGAIARAAVSIPGVMRKGLDNDYKKNLY